LDSHGADILCGFTLRNFGYHLVTVPLRDSYGARLVPNTPHLCLHELTSPLCLSTHSEPQGPPPFSRV
jgi:hypothetical protein